MTAYLPICLNVDQGPVLIVGGGAIAQQKLEVLTRCGARVRLVAPAVNAPIRRLAREHAGRVEIIERGFIEGDLQGVAVAIAATDQPALNRQVHQAAHARGLLVNVVDDPAQCDFIFPSILKRDELTVAVSTAGASPALARLARQALEQEFDDDFGQALALTRQLRAEARRRVRCPGGRRAVNEVIARRLATWRRHLPPDYERRVRDDLEAIAAIDALVPISLHPAHARLGGAE